MSPNFGSQCDEIWSFVGAKAKNVESMKRPTKDAGDVWTWTAIDADTKLVPSWLIGDRSAVTAHFFMKDLASPLGGPRAAHYGRPQGVPERR